MSETIVASTQYGDFNGTLSIDQADGRDLLRLLAAGRRCRRAIARSAFPSPLLAAAGILGTAGI